MKNYVILGVGRFGESLALTLTDLGHDVMVIDHNQTIINNIAPYVTNAVVADVTDGKVFEQLGLSNFDAAIVAIGTNLEAAILATVYLKELGLKHIICKASTILHGQVLKKVGADEVIIPEHDMGQKVAYSLSSNNVIDFFNLVGDYSIFEVYPLKIWSNKSLHELDIRKNFGVNVLGIIKENGDFLGNPDNDTIVDASDKLVILGTAEDFALFEKEKEKERNKEKSNR